VARRWGEQPRPPGRPPVDGKIRAKVLGLAVEHPDWGSRRIAREAGASRRSVQRWLAAEGLRGSGAARLRRVAYTAEPAPAGVMVSAGGFVAWAKALLTAMTEDDHERFDRYRGAPASTYVWTFR
jgi:hypothetical protein